MTVKRAEACDIEPIYRLCKELIDTYEDVESIAYEKVLNWVHRKLETSIAEYSTIWETGKKVGYFHFYQEEEGAYELDDLYVFPEYQNRGIGTRVIEGCCSSVNAPVMLYVFVKNQRAVALYERLGFSIVERVGHTRYRMRRAGR